MSQIRDKKAHRKHIATMNPINAKSVQLIELHAFAYRLLFVYLSESFDFLKYNHHCISVHYITLGTNMIIIYSKHNLIGYFVCPINAKQNFNLI